MTAMDTLQSLEFQHGAGHSQPAEALNESESAVELLESRIQAATSALLKMQREDGHWSFEFEADATIPAEYILLTHYLGEEADALREAKIGNYLRRIQGKHGGWPLFHKAISI